MKRTTTLARLRRSVRLPQRVVEVVRCARQSGAWPTLTGAYLGVRPLGFPYEFRTRVGGRMRLESFHDGSKAGLFRALRDAGFRLVRDVEFLPDSGVAHFRRR